MNASHAALFAIMALGVGGLLERPAALAQDKGRAVAGALTCKGQGTVGMIIGSKEALDCTFAPTTGRPEKYSGTITKVGVDIGIRGANTLVWTVLFTTDTIPAEALSGSYAGISADASVGIGGGANILLGGSKRAVALQPVSLQGQAGINVAAGVTELTLRHVPGS